MYHRSRKELPLDVQRVKLALSSEPGHELFKIGMKLMATGDDCQCSNATDQLPDAVSMWNTLYQRRNDTDDLWVWAFIGAAQVAATPPRFCTKNKEDRKSLAKEIKSAATELARLLEINDLDCQIVQLEGSLFNGFFFYEDFDITNQARIDSTCRKKLKVTELLDRVASRSRSKIDVEPTPGKALNPVQFVRRLAENYTRPTFGQPLLGVVATACNLIHETKYTEADISKLIR